MHYIKIDLCGKIVDECVGQVVRELVRGVKGHSSALAREWNRGESNAGRR